MIKQLLLFTCLIASLSLNAQSQLGPRQLPFQQKAMPSKKTALTGAEPMATGSHQNPNLPLLSPSFRTEVEETVGQTIYDLQSNSSTPRRLASNADGSIRYATWTIGNNSGSGYPDRGSGINIQNSGSWGAIPTERIEDVRCGWANMGLLADGTPVVVAHRTDINQMYFSRWENGDWVHSVVPSAVTSGIIWPRMAVGGPDGNTIHLVGITYPTGNGGAVYEGVDGHVLYFRSLDGGLTWDQQDVILPQINKDFYSRMDADSYAIDASGSTVVLALFADLGDVKVSKSEDNGATWTTWTVKDFPIDAYTVDQGYTLNDIPLDTLGPDSLAIQSSDNTGTVLIDHDGKTHVWYGEMYYLDGDLTDGNFSYFPAWMGLRYWNESFGEDSTQVAIGGILDANANGTADIAGIDAIPLYFSSLTSHPSAGIDAAGNIFVAYSSLTEDFIHEASTPNPGQHCRHIYITYSGDGGETWSNPIDVIREDLVIEPDLLTLYETMFPSMDRKVDAQVHLLYQADFEPGLSVRGDADAPADNYINYLAIDLAEFGLTNAQVIQPQEMQFELAPNPASGQVRMSWMMPQAGPAAIYLHDMTGRLVRELQSGLQQAGNHVATMGIGGLPQGVYLARLVAGGKTATQRLVVK
jgi:hypothetical protein